MGITKKAAPDGMWDAFEAGKASREGGEPGVLVSRTTAPSSGPATRASRLDYPVTTIDLDQVRLGAQAPVARRPRWRCIEPASGRVVAADMKQDPAAGTMQMSAYSPISPENEELQAWRALGQLDQVLAADFEVELLRIPSLLVEAFRLRPVAGGESLVYPLRSVTAGIRRGQVLTEAQFLQLLRPLAESLHQAGAGEP